MLVSSAAFPPCLFGLSSSVVVALRRRARVKRVSVCREESNHNFLHRCRLTNPNIFMSKMPFLNLEIWMIFSSEFGYEGAFDIELTSMQTDVRRHYPSRLKDKNGSDKSSHSCIDIGLQST